MTPKVIQILKLADEPGFDFDPMTAVDRAVEELAALRPEEYRSVRKEKARTLKISVRDLDEKVKAMRRSHMPEGPEGFLSCCEAATDGLYFNNPSDGERTWLCEPFEVMGLGRDQDGSGHSLILQFFDISGCSQRVSFNRSDLAGDAVVFFRKLLDRGIRYCTGKMEMDYIRRFLVYSKPTTSCEVIRRPGWYGSCFVTPLKIVGDQAGKELLFEAGNCKTQDWGVQGTLEQWRTGVSALCPGNTLLIFAASMGFSPPLLRFSSRDGGGFNLVGASSSGKTIAMLVGNSIWGSPDRIKPWRTTTNALEALAELHNDSLQCLDEMGQALPGELGPAVYMLGNNAGKSRANRDGSAGKMRTWRSLQLSTGENGVASYIQEGRQKFRAGHEVRMLDLPADAGKKMGVFENLHGRSASNILASELTDNVGKFYGTPIYAFLEKLTALDLMSLEERYVTERDDFLRTEIPSWAVGQVSRVARRFFLIGFGGELATEMGITGWPKGVAMQAALGLLNAWVKSRGGYGLQEASQVLQQVTRFIEQYGDSRFEELGASLHSDSKSPNVRAGFRVSSDSVTYHYILPETFRQEILAGMEFNTAVKVLLEAGILIPDPNGKSSTSRRFGKHGQIRVYVLKNVLSAQDRSDSEVEEEFFD